MTTRTDFNDAWERLDDRELGAVVQCLTRMREGKLAPRFTTMLISTADQETAYRTDLRSKDDTVNLPAFSSGELAAAWHGALCLQRVLIFSETLVEFASLLLTAVCCEMAARLDSMEKLDSAFGKSGSN
jgi:hypothetical protein